ncbi:hypothetical protein HPP92_020938 [Vanilla planifolia]|uniref:Uncharacterized protein n=1 Tax=Vanilla planifolia TaxID=51239 RepID=A0A835PUI4_VANPL|nr:hypothetical protein HPP92_020938 [Vanilla planifolia]
MCSTDFSSSHGCPTHSLPWRTQKKKKAVQLLNSKFKRRGRSHGCGGEEEIELVNLNLYLENICIMEENKRLMERAVCLSKENQALLSLLQMPPRKR